MKVYQVVSAICLWAFLDLFCEGAGKRNTVSRNEPALVGLWGLRIFIFEGTSQVNLQENHSQHQGDWAVSVTWIRLDPISELFDLFAPRFLCSEHLLGAKHIQKKHGFLQISPYHRCLKAIGAQTTKSCGTWPGSPCESLSKFLSKDESIDWLQLQGKSQKIYRKPKDIHGVFLIFGCFWMFLDVFGCFGPYIARFPADFYPLILGSWLVWKDVINALLKISAEFPHWSFSCEAWAGLRLPDAPYQLPKGVLCICEHGAIWLSNDHVLPVVALKKIEAWLFLFCFTRLLYISVLRSFQKQDINNPAPSSHSTPTQPWPESLPPA